MSELDDDVSWPPAPIETDRLVLRAPLAADREGLIDLLASQKVREYLGGAMDRDQLERDAPTTPRSTPGGFFVADSTGFVGVVRLDRRDPAAPGHVRPEGNELELSYMLLPRAWGQGYAYEACRATLDWAAEQLADDVVIVCTQISNLRARRLAERLEFAQAGTFAAHGATQWLGRRPLRDT